MRKTYDSNDQAELIAAVTAGETVPAAARRLGVTLSTAYKWMTKSRTKTQLALAPKFVELVAPRAATAAVVVRVGIAEIEVRAGFDAALLGEVVSVLRGAA